MIDYSKLEEKLSTFTAKDYSKAEREERRAGNNYSTIAFTSSFHTRLAAKALGVSVEEIESLPINDFTDISNRVLNFLFKPSDTQTTSKETSEDAQSI